MNSKIINQFPIRDYLAGSGIDPAKENGHYGMYYSPFREDHNASMKVDYNKNLWIDYGTGEGWDAYRPRDAYGKLFQRWSHAIIGTENCRDGLFFFSKGTGNNSENSTTTDYFYSEN
jgi:hypothetical protein